MEKKIYIEKYIDGIGFGLGLGVTHEPTCITQGTHNEEIDELKRVIRKISEEFILTVEREYEISLSLSKETIPLFEKAIDTIKHHLGSANEAIEIGLTAFLTELLLEAYNGLLFKTDNGYGVRLFNSFIGQNVEIYPSAWIAKRIQNGQNESIAFKLAFLSSKRDQKSRLSSEWPEDKILAANFAKRLMVSASDEQLINRLIQKLLENPEKISFELLNNTNGIFGKIQENDKSYKYFLGRIYKILFFVAKLKFKFDYRKFGNIFKTFSINQVFLSPDEYSSLLEYIKDVPFGVNDNIFEQIFDMEKSSKLFKKGNLKIRNEAIIYLLELNGRKIYHHNIKELKKILNFIREDNEASIKYLSTYQVEYRQGCYKAIEYIFSYKFNGKELYDNFVCQKDIIIWLDNANGKEPKKAWVDKLEVLNQRGISQDMETICKWILAHDEHRYDEKNNWLDDVFNRFQKSAKWFLGM